MALTLRAVGGLTTAQIAAAFLVPEATMAHADQPAKQAVREIAAARGSGCATPAERTNGSRGPAVLYLVFNEATPPPGARS
ncbi:hypothetical protein GCM10020229_64760 [Kitasatospora albolonga]|uniref:hypothetical protein n=1 Tax=Kitasatospora albolonga TaxID=68173 RepID=UPI0031EB8466